MRGEFRVQIRSKRLNYDFTLRRNITLVRGDSGTGKSTMIQLLRLAEKESRVQYHCKAPFYLPEGRYWKDGILRTENSIIFIDEDSRFLLTEEFASAIKGTSNYYVLITRANLEMLPYSMDEVYEVFNSNKFNYLIPAFKKNKKTNDTRLYYNGGF